MWRHFHNRTTTIIVYESELLITVPTRSIILIIATLAPLMRKNLYRAVHRIRRHEFEMNDRYYERTNKHCVLNKSLIFKLVFQEILRTPQVFKMFKC